MDKRLRLLFVTDVSAIKNTTLPIAAPFASVFVESYNGSRIAGSDVNVKTVINN